LQFVERHKETPTGILIGALPGCKACTINAVVYVIVDELRKSCLFLDEIVREELCTLAAQSAKGAGEHTAYVIFGVVYDTMRFFIPKHGDGDAACEIAVGCVVGLCQKGKAVHWIVAVARPVTESPAAFVAYWINHRHADDVLQTLQMSDDNG